MRTDPKCKTVLLLCVLLLFASFCSAGWTDESKVDSRFSRTGFAVSPDGLNIAYPLPAYDDYGGPITQVWVSKLDGSEARQIASLSDFWNISWYDPSHIAASEWNVNIIHILPLDKSKSRTLSLTDSYDWAQSTISPDGKWVAFNAVKKSPRKFGIFVLNTQTGEIKKLNDDTVQSYVEWSPDSKKLIYGMGSYQKDYPLKVVDVPSGATREMGQKGVGARWSPDGKWIAYTGNILNGGSWYGGIPMDGSLIKTNIITKKSVVLTEPPVNKYDEAAGISEMAGAFDPHWSPGSSKIAYRRVHTIRDLKTRKNTLNEDELWVMNSDGSNKHKISDKYLPMAWSHDGKSVFLKDENGITRVAIDSGDKKTLVAWVTPNTPEPKEADWKTVTADHATVDYAWVDPKWSNAILKIARVARDVYKTEFGCDMPDMVTVKLQRYPTASTNLWNDGESTMFLTIKSESDLAPPIESGIFNIYGICHEMGHMAMYRRIQVLGLPKGVAEGWAHYAGSVVTDEVYKRLGKDVWPTPYDYSADGTKRLEKQTSDPDALRDPTTKAASAFYQAQKKYGAKAVFKAMNEGTADKPLGKDVMPRFVAALEKNTGDKSAGQLFSEDLITTQIDWQVADRQITDKTTEGQISDPDASSITLRYDNGKSDGQWSTAGSGHAIMFKCPAGKWTVDAVSMFGSRYGSYVPPADNFSIYILDADFQVIKEIQEPYAKLEQGDNRWYRFDFDRVMVPEGFYVCVSFNPTATKGFYMNYSNTKKSHSRYALPWTFVSDIKNGSYDWMIRPHLKKAGE